MSDRGKIWFDPRAWLLWGIAAGLPPLIGRNPFVLLATLMSVIAVREAWAAAPGAGAWRGIVRLALIFSAIGVLFNVLTAHIGDRVFARLPDAFPIIGGPLTLNALVYGLLSAIAAFTLVLVGATLGAVLDWTTLLRLLPARLTIVAVAGSVAWAFIPQTVTAFTEIREAQLARGHRIQGVRDYAPLLVPLLAGGLERAIILAEALESRGFGATMPSAPAARWRGVLTILGLTAATVGVYALAVGRLELAMPLLAGAGIGLYATSRDPSPASMRQRTRYRQPRWERQETQIAASAGVVLVMQGLILIVDPGGFSYEPYPSVTLPTVNLPLLAALGLLLTPALTAPPTVARRRP
jgi:energy-coupling factor transport system permease protein